MSNGHRNGFPVYPESIREEAVRLFKSGYGYKATATMLGLQQGTVREWRRKWAAKAKQGEIVRFDQSLKEVMQERDMEYIWREYEDVLAEAYRRGARNHASSASRYGIMRVLIEISSSSLFERLPIYASTRNRQYPVYKLL